MIRTIVFDVGETLLDERGLRHRWADWLGVSRDTFMCELRGVIRRGEHHRRVFDVFRPGMDLAAAQQARQAAGDEPGFRREDFYPDALPCLAELRAMGLRLGVAGNNTAQTEQFLRDAGTPVDFIASSATWGIEKPSSGFFEKLVDAAGADPGAVAYVGDRLDNDVLPAQAAGLTGVFLRRGLWADVQREWAEAARASLTIDTLAELPVALARYQPARS
jgi:FMN phosphatase YigB (HAD superfamily)